MEELTRRFLIVGEEGEARRGVIEVSADGPSHHHPNAAHHPNSSMATPCFLLHTLKGSPQNLTVDLARQLDAAEGVHLNLSDMYTIYSLHIPLS
jgi:hypothetical protein